MQITRKLSGCGSYDFIRLKAGSYLKPLLTTGCRIGQHSVCTLPGASLGRHLSQVGSIISTYCFVLRFPLLLSIIPVAVDLSDGTIKALHLVGGWVQS